MSDYNGNSVRSTRIPVLDYPAIPNAYKVLSGVTIANEYSNGGYARPGGTNGTNSDGSPKGSLFMYKLKITPDGFLSLSYSVNGGSWLGVLANQSITSSNGALPSTIRFGFAGSTGGSSNIHEVLCFKAASLDTSSSSAATNLKQSAKVTSSSQAYFAYYEDVDLSLRLARAGWRFECAPDALARHEGSRTGRRTPFRRAFWTARNRWRTLFRNFEPALLARSLGPLLRADLAHVRQLGWKGVALPLLVWPRVPFLALRARAETRKLSGWPVIASKAP